MLVQSAARRVAIVGGSRIPFARSYGAYTGQSNQDLLVAALRSLVERFQLQGQRLGDVIGGAVIKHSRDFNLVRESLLSADLDPQTPGLDIQRACGTGLEAAILVANKIALGQIDAGIACGVDTVSDPPVVLPSSFGELLLRSYRGRNFGQRLAPWLKLRPRDLKPILPAVVEPRTGLSMGQSCELMAKTWKISRAEQDRVAVDSHLKAAAAWKEGFYDDLVVPHAGLQRDNNVRRRRHGGKTGHAPPGVRHQRLGHAHGRQQHAADRRRGRGAARFRGHGRASAGCRSWRTCAPARAGRSISPAARKAC